MYVLYIVCIYSVQCIYIRVCNHGRLCIYLSIYICCYVLFNIIREDIMDFMIAKYSHKELVDLVMTNFEKIRLPRSVRELPEAKTLSRTKGLLGISDHLTEGDTVWERLMGTSIVNTHQTVSTSRVKRDLELALVESIAAITVNQDHDMDLSVVEIGDAKIGDSKKIR